MFSWRWKDYRVWGVGCDARGLGGTWYTSIAPNGYKTQFDAQAAVESHDLALNEPALDMDDVDAVWEQLDSITPVCFDVLSRRTKLSAGRLSDALARGYDLSIFRITILACAPGYLRATERCR